MYLLHIQTRKFKCNGIKRVIWGSNYQIVLHLINHICLCKHKYIIVDLEANLHDVFVVDVDTRKSG